jgi:hypothetical protein
MNRMPKARYSKEIRQEAAKRTVDALWTTIGALLDRFPRDECERYIRHAGYVQSGLKRSNQLTLESSSALDVESLVDGFVRNAHGFIIREVGLQSFRNLFRVTSH